MDKRINKMIPLSFDLKTVGYGGYFILLAFAATIIFHLMLMGGSATKYISLQTTVFIISIVGVLVWILPAYMEVVKPESKELILSLPINGLTFGFFRMVRLFVLYTAFVLALLFVVYVIGNENRLEFGIVDVFLISGAVFFISGLGTTVFLISKNLVIGYGIPILWVSISFFYRGGASWLWHTCHWINPNPFETSFKYAITHWIGGLVLYIVSSYIIKQRKYLIR